MKKHYSVVCSGALLVALTLFVLSSCNNNGGGAGYAEQWTLSGTITLSGTVTDDVKIAVFYLGQNLLIDDTTPVVSNVVNLGTSIGSALAFSLNIDVSGISHVDFDTVDVWVWEDTNANDNFDAVEDESDVGPAAGCSVFSQIGGVAYFSYNESFPGFPKGWMVWNASDDFESITTATLSGAKLENLSPL